ncbi:putative SOUL heme-binding protein [Helianthus annuus]|nr:putative SOUL heme-binding protein [Helianthus annuus]
MFSSLPDPNKENVSIRSVEGGFAAVLKFSGKPTEDIVSEKEKLLRSSVLSDGLKPKEGFYWLATMILVEQKVL